jgi:hypothetical protein
MKEQFNIQLTQILKLKRFDYFFDSNPMYVTLGLSGIIIIFLSVYVLFQNSSSNIINQSALPSGGGGNGETIIEKIIKKTNEYKWYLLGALVVGVALYAYSKGYVFSDNKEEAINSLTNQAIPDNSSPTTPTSTTSTASTPTTDTGSATDSPVNITVEKDITKEIASGSATDSPVNITVEKDITKEIVSGISQQQRVKMVQNMINTFNNQSEKLNTDPNLTIEQIESIKRVLARLTKYFNDHGINPNNPN